MRIIASLLFVLILTGCNWRSKNRLNYHTAENYEVEFLFEKYGCKVYRFRDNFNYIYFTNCNNTTIGLVGDTIKNQSIDFKNMVYQASN